jgi:hypothetical protein
MKLTWHIVIKDWRRLRIPIAFWALLLAFQLIIGVRLLTGRVLDTYYFERLSLLVGILAALQAVIGYLLAPALVLEDGLVESTAFWPTRPISGSRLMGAKLLTCLLLFGALPALITLPWWLYCGYGIREIGFAAFSFAVVQVLPVAVGAMVATLARNMGRFIAGSVLLFAFVAVLFVTLSPSDIVFLRPNGGNHVLQSGLSALRLSALYWIGAAGCGVVIVHQYLTRRLVRSFALLVCVLWALMAEMKWWPWEPKGHFHEAAGSMQGPALDSNISIVPSGTANVHISKDLPGAARAFVVGDLVVKNAPRDVMLRYDRPVIGWRWPDQQHYETRGSMPGSWVNIRVSTYQIESVLPHRPHTAWEANPRNRHWIELSKFKSYDEWLAADRPANTSWTYDAEVPPRIAQRMLSEPPVCTIRLEGDLLAAELEPEIALAASGTWRARTDGIRIASSGWDAEKNQMRVVVVERHAGRTAGFSPEATSYEEDAPAAYAVINREQGESSVQSRPTASAFSIRIATVAIEWKSLLFPGPSNLVDGAAEWTGANHDVWGGPSYRDWFSGATFGRVMKKVTGRFSRSITIDPYAAVEDKDSTLR